MKIISRAQIYRITYPNGKIYIGQDRTDDINYFGSAHSMTVAGDFNRTKRKSFTIRKDILWEGRNVSVAQINTREIALIRKHNAANPTIGYNRSPRGRRSQQ